MKHAKHTPGPWRVKTGTYFNNEAEGDTALREYKWVGFGPIGDEMPVLARSISENEANAALIAAAPEMLEALEMVLRETDDAEWISKISKIVAKARGES